MFVNEACCRCFELSPEEIVGKRFLPLVLDEDRALVEAQNSIAVADEPGGDGEERVCVPDGRGPLVPMGESWALR